MINRWYVNSKNAIRYRLMDEATGVQVTSATVTADVTKNGVSVVAGLAMTYSATDKLYQGDGLAGAYVGTVTAAQVPTAGNYIAVVTVVLGGLTVHTTTLTFEAVSDTGE